MRSPHHHPAAKTSAAGIGLTLTSEDFTGIFLAITDALWDDGATLGDPFKAKRIGNTRDAERWAITNGKAVFDVVYAPDEARVVAVVRHRALEVAA